MTKYAAFLRGIMPTNPNMRNEKLRAVFEGLGFANVRTVIASGNILFESSSANAKSLETLVEKALPKQLGFSSTAFIYSQQELQRLVDRHPFGNLQDSPHSKLNVTFLKQAPKARVHDLKGKGFTILGTYDRAVCSAIDLTKTKTPELMSWLEKQFGKEITTRTWKTIMKIVAGLGD